jgi:hypothetical protein
MLEVAAGCGGDGGGAHDGLGQGVRVGWAEQAERARYLPRHDENHAISEAEEVSRDVTYPGQAWRLMQHKGERHAAQPPCDAAHEARCAGY